MKRISSLLLSFLMLFTLLPTAALAEGEQGNSEPQTPYLKMECNSQPETSFSLPAGTYEVRFYIKDGPNSPYPTYPTNEQIILTPTGAVASIAYSTAKACWVMTVSDTAGNGSISGTLKMDENTTIDLGSVTVTSTGKQAKSGTFAVQYSDVSYSAGGEATLTLPVGEHTVALTVTDNGRRSFLDTLDFVTCSGCISEIKAGGQQNGVQFYKITVSDSGEAGYIQYNTENNRVTISRGSSQGSGQGGQGGSSVRPTYGDAVQQDDANRARIDEQYDDFFYWTGNEDGSGAISVPFDYNGVTYYLGACEWDENGSSISPKGHGSRGLIGSETLTMSVRVFDLATGSASGADASYTLREDLRSAMLAEGYTFDLIVRPTENGCRYYPAAETVERSIQIGNNTYTDSAWSALTFDRAYCAGCWVFEGQLWKDNVLIASSTASERMSRMDTIHVSLTGDSVEQLNAEIAAEAAKYTNLSELEWPRVMFTLPGGEFTGELVIPKSSCFITLSGAGARSDKISTTIKGGVKIEGNQMVSVDSIRFIGAGKETQALENGKPNSALYGKGEGIPNRCILEDYYCAV